MANNRQIDLSTIMKYYIHNVYKIIIFMKFHFDIIHWKTRGFSYNLSHLSAHVVNRLLREKWKCIPKFLSGEKLLKNVTLQIFNFIPVR